MDKTINHVNGHSHLIANRYGDVTDWSGRILSKRVFNCLKIGDIVRVHIDDIQDLSSMAPYFKIVKIKDGTFWGIALNTYNTLDWMKGINEGDTVPFRKQNIIEIPITWQSKTQQRKLERYVLRKGYPVTGCR